MYYYYYYHCYKCQNTVYMSILWVHNYPSFLSAKTSRHPLRAVWPRHHEWCYNMHIYTDWIDWTEKFNPNSRVSSQLFTWSCWWCCKCMSVWCFIRGCMQHIPKSQQGHFHFFMVAAHNNQTITRGVRVVEEKFERISKSEACLCWINKRMETVFRACQRKGEAVHTINDAVVHLTFMVSVRQTSMWPESRSHLKLNLEITWYKNNIQMLQGVKAFSTNLRETTDAENNNQNNLCVSHSLHWSHCP